MCRAQACSAHQLHFCSLESGEDLNIEEKKSIEDGSEDLDQNIFLDDDEPIEVYGEGK